MTGDRGGYLNDESPSELNSAMVADACARGMMPDPGSNSIMAMEEDIG